MKKTLISLALAGTLSASSFLSEVKDFLPNENAQDLNQQLKSIKKQSNARQVSPEKLATIQQSIDIMHSVNKRTFTDFLPTVEVSLQLWVKTDKEALVQAMDWMDDALSLRLKQYTNMKEMLKNTNAPHKMLQQIKDMEKMSRDAKRTITTYQKQIKVISAIQKELDAFNEISVKDFWIPVLELKENSIIIKVDGIAETDFDAIESLEERLNTSINSKYISAIMVA